MMTGLHIAAKKGYTDIVKLLIDYGADINSKDCLGRSPLYYAVVEKHTEIVKILVQNLCDPWSPE
jgi:ankyrin repeat protein